MTVQLDDAARLLEVAADAYFEMFPDWTVDELLLHPTEARKLVGRVMMDLGTHVEEDRVLRALLNGRKTGRLEPG